MDTKLIKREIEITNDFHKKLNVVLAAAKLAVENFPKDKTAATKTADLSAAMRKALPQCECEGTLFSFHFYFTYDWICLKAYYRSADCNCKSFTAYVARLEKGKIDYVKDFIPLREDFSFEEYSEAADDLISTQRALDEAQEANSRAQEKVNEFFITSNRW
jgi:hypothetical protein